MTVNDIIRRLQNIPSRERERPILLCGDCIDYKTDEDIVDFEIDWIDCAESLLLLFNKKGGQA
jgi:hypothetical protein